VPRAYFASVALAILNVCQTNITPAGNVLGVLGKELTLADCPTELRPIMRELVAVGFQSQDMTREDEEDAIRLASRGKVVPEPRMDRVRKMLERGVGYEEETERRTPATDEGRRSVEGRSVQFTNRLNALALTLSRVRAFRERQDRIFEVLTASA